MSQPGSSSGLSGTALKRIACISMLIDHIAASCLDAGVFLHAAAVSQQAMTVYTVMRCIGRLAFPIYCFLLVEGFLHTHSVRSYAGRLAVFGLVSELPFDLAFYRTPFYWQHQNVYWTLALGVLALACIRRTEVDGHGRTAAGTLGALGCAVLAEVLRTDYGAIGVALIVALYLMRRSRPAQCLTGAVVVSYELPAPMAFVPVWFYNGQRGRCSSAEKWAYYLFYPVHLAVLAMVTNIIL